MGYWLAREALPKATHMFLNKTRADSGQEGEKMELGDGGSDIKGGLKEEVREYVCRTMGD